MSTETNAKPAHGPATIGNILKHLYDNALGNLDRESMRWLADGAQLQAHLMAANLAETAEGIGCLVADDEVVGSFRGDDLPNLLFSIAASAETIDGLMLLGQRARDCLDGPEAPVVQAKMAKARQARRDTK